MRRPLLSQSMSWALASTVVLIAGSAHATLNPQADRGQSIVEFSNPGRSPEICVIPRRLNTGKYSQGDLQTEQELCQMDAHSNVAVCPKLNSTNPGLDFHLIPDGMTKSAVEQKACKVPRAGDSSKNAAQKLAKFKLSTSCSYTPSILGYYHLSRLLGDVGNVPPSVLRTFDLGTHKQMADLALERIRRNRQSGQLIDQTWRSLKSALDAGAGSRRKDALLTDFFDQSYGALSENPIGEAFYSEFYNRAASGTSRSVAFRDRNPIFRTLTNSSDISRLVGRDFNPRNVQSMVQLKDASEMILMDTILSQQDRFGNIHYYQKWYYMDASERDANGNPKIKSKKKLKPEEVARLGAVQVKEMLLKDNDCGVTKGNEAKKAGLLQRVAHMDPSTYKRLIQLSQNIESADYRVMFQQELAFTDTDYRNTRDNIKEAAATLQSACRSGKLKLDLDLEAHFAGRPVTVSCD